MSDGYSSGDIEILKSQFLPQLRAVQGTLASLHGVSKWIISFHLDSASMIVTFWKDYFNDCYDIIKNEDMHNVDGGYDNGYASPSFHSLPLNDKINHLLNLIYLASDILQSTIKVSNNAFSDLFAPVSDYYFYFDSQWMLVCSIELMNNVEITNTKLNIMYG